MKQFTLGALLGDASPTPVRGDMKIVHSTQTFWALKNENVGDKVGNKKYWIGHVATDGVDWYTLTTFWQETSDGSDSKKQTSAATRVTQKNVGKANETSLEQQAYSELNSIVNKQRDKKYRLEGEELDSQGKNYPLPMLAHVYEDKKHKVKFPVFAQPKYDGMRVLSDGNEMWSRKGKLMIPQIVEHLLFDTQGYILDGELIMPEDCHFQDSMSAAKCYDPKLSPRLLFRVYDVMISDKVFSERFEILKKIVQDAPPGVVLSETVLLHSEVELVAYHVEKEEQGWEGSIVRTNEQGYEINKRTNQLLKKKSFKDDEFEVIGVETGSGKFEGLGILVLKTKTGATFRAVTEGTTEFRRSLYQNPEKVIGKMWTVKFIGYTKNANPDLVVPHHATAIAERDYDLQG